jgi:hypothetical protein
MPTGKVGRVCGRPPRASVRPDAAGRRGVREDTVNVDDTPSEYGRLR